MSTRSIIARAGEQEGHFAGRYIHCDGMPTSMGAALWSLLHSHFQNDLSKMLAYLIDAPHAVAGWSAIAGKDFSLKPGYGWQKAVQRNSSYEVYSKDPDYRRPQCFAGRKGEEPMLFTEKDLEDGTDIEWLYVFDEAERKLFVRDVSAKEDVAVIDLGGEQPKWDVVECGENLERCGHYAWYHKLVPKDCNLSTQAWLERRPLEFRDAVAFIVKGKRYKASGSGGDSDFLNRMNYQRGCYAAFPSRTWVATLIAGNGSRIEVPVAKKTGNEYTPLPGIIWVYPATKNTPEKVVGA